ncbi:methylated-DNA--[protein]-cysteine S-methyltransferase [Kocuria palustris]|uniref:methylated-DNA--[protein]-cysteine S-methyltransferase n=1 Tax=Kocuria palustris TaxID=71999 RepID=UPI00195B4325|nr:methylated-DNA--[protein]-cysteine S-methyltransferase [Kocuria palustris]MBM7823669.1 methylated-DNA-[protein]-cysteine S-methyltransferase [Kocuria palustris]
MTEKTPTPCPGDDLATERDTLFPIESSAVADLRSRLSAQAGERGLVDVAYRTLETPVGPLLLAATETGLVRVAFEREGFDAVLESLAQRISPRVLEAPRRLDAAAVELDEYFEGRRHSFDVPLDFALTSGFRRSVQTSLPGIDYGRTRSYKEIAELVGSPRAVRAVGTACATNPLPVVLPCHRVLRSDGGLGGYIGGLEAKTALLSLEKAA